MNIEPLEPRVAPAFLIAANGLSARFTDEDGDLATLRISAGDLHHATIATTPAGAGEQLALLDVSAAEFNRTNITLAAVKKPGGDGLVNVGFLSAAGRDLGAVKIAGDLGAIVCGDGATDSGFGLKSLTVRTLGRFGAATGAPVNGDGIAGTQPGFSDSGEIQAGGRIASVAIGGSIVAGLDDSTGGDLFRNGTILARDDIGSVSVKGSLLGRESANGATPVIISARGQDATSASLTATSDLAIGKISIGGRVENARILAGYDYQIPGAGNGNAQIGPVKVGGDWVGSSIVAGVKDTNSDGFGNSDDSILGAVANSIAKIATITIGGTVFGTPGGGDHFGFVSHAIGKFKAGAFTAALRAGAPPDVIALSLLTGDTTLREIVL